MQAQIERSAFAYTCPDVSSALGSNLRVKSANPVMFGYMKSTIFHRDILDRK
jgi:hypothetical protein